VSQKIRSRIFTRARVHKIRPLPSRCRWYRGTVKTIPNVDLLGLIAAIRRYSLGTEKSLVSEETRAYKVARDPFLRLIYVSLVVSNSVIVLLTYSTLSHSKHLFEDIRRTWQIAMWGRSLRKVTEISEISAK